MRDRVKVLHVAQEVLPYRIRSRASDLDLVGELRKHVDLVIYTTDQAVSDMLVSEYDGIRFYVAPRKKSKFLLYPCDHVIKRITGTRRLLSAITEVRKVILTERPDIIHAEPIMPYGLIAHCAALATSAPIDVITTADIYHGLIVPFEDPERERRENGIIHRVLTRFVIGNRYVRANSELTRDWIVRSGGREDAVRVIVAHIDRSFFPLAGIVRVKRALGPRFVSVCGYAPHKGLDVLIEAFAQVLQSSADAVLHIYGRTRMVSGLGDYKRYLQGRVDGKGLGGNIKLFDVIDHAAVPRTIAQYDYNVCASRGETLNLVVVEAASVGVPSVVTEWCGIRHWVERYGTGIIASCSQESLADAMLRAIRLEVSEYQKMSKNCYGLASEFHPDCVARQLVEYYKDVCARRRVRT